MILRIHLQIQILLFLIVETCYPLRLVPRLRQCGKKHARQDCDDRNYHKEFYKSKSFGFPLKM